MPTSLLIEYRTVYGQALIYPANLNAALFCTLTGRKTLSARDLEIARQLGHIVAPAAGAA
jgi:histone H3/H4